MDKKEFNEKTGKLISSSEDYYTFEPFDLPLEIEYDDELVNLLSQASISVGNLSNAGQNMDNPHLLIMPYMNKEAVLSSKIEGTKTTLSEVFIHESDKKTKDSDLLEVYNYINALKYGLEQIKKEEISEKLIKEMHVLLMQGVRGQDKNPGNYKNNQNYIGFPGQDILEARFVPASPKTTPTLMDNLISYLNKDKNHPELIKIAMMHYQFETIHPFIDGNGRIGRVLIMLYICKSKLLSQPLLYLSDYLEKNRREYMDNMLEVSKKGLIEKWLKFFLLGIKKQADEALIILNKLEDYRNKMRKKLMENTNSTRALRVLDQLFSNPYITSKEITEILNSPYSTAESNIKILMDNGVLKVLEGVTKGTTRAGKVYAAQEIIRILGIDKEKTN